MSFITQGVAAITRNAGKIARAVKGIKNSGPAITKGLKSSGVYIGKGLKYWCCYKQWCFYSRSICLCCCSNCS